jgi:hypothetical protein
MQVRILILLLMLALFSCNQAQNKRANKNSNIGVITSALTTTSSQLRPFCDSSETRVCDIENGVGVQHRICEFDGIPARYSSCKVRSCDEGFNLIADMNKCELPPRSYPSIFQAWNRIENLPNVSEAELLAKHDLIFSGINTFKLKWQLGNLVQFQGDSLTLVDYNNSEELEQAKSFVKQIKSLNPHAKILVELRYRGAKYRSQTYFPQFHINGYFEPRSQFWLKDDAGNPYYGWGEDLNSNGIIEPNEVKSSLLDFSNDELISLVSQKAKALADTGFIDGIMLDWFKPGITSWLKDPLTNTYNGQSAMTLEVEEKSRIKLLEEIRAITPEDFLIIGNGNYKTHDIFKDLLNGTFMELYRKDARVGYTQADYRKMEDTLYWSEMNLRQPTINGIEFWRKTYPNEINSPFFRVFYRNTQENLKSMRLVTALSLTHSNGYSLFADPNILPEPDHLHNWYDFYDADLGVPKQKRRKAVDGRAIREFTKGFAVYNSQDNPYRVEFEVPVEDVVSGLVSRVHYVDATDGGIFLKK